MLPGGEAAPPEEGGPPRGPPTAREPGAIFSLTLSPLPRPALVGQRQQTTNVKTPQTTKHTASTLVLVSILLYCVIDELQCSHCVTVETGPHVRHWRQLCVRSLAFKANDLGQVS